MSESIYRSDCKEHYQSNRMPPSKDLRGDEQDSTWTRPPARDRKDGYQESEWDTNGYISRNCVAKSHRMQFVIWGEGEKVGDDPQSRDRKTQTDVQRGLPGLLNTQTVGGIHCTVPGFNGSCATLGVPKYVIQSDALLQPFIEVVV